MNEILTFSELVAIIEGAQNFIEDESGEPIQDIVNNFQNSLGFAAGHLMGMRDCVLIVQKILQQSIVPEIKTAGEEE